ncbi:retrovirus-related Pol polyprotein from transposon opus [Trichonephila clavipes]|nr:retrovirus-related Pol polyprotein from transposon opus [Trichonephila clavipes]
MAFLGRTLKVDLKCLAEELRETVTEEMKVPALEKMILAKKERIYNPRFTAAVNLRSDSPKKSLDERVNTEEEEQEPTITEYDEDNGNDTEKFKKQQQICDTLQEAWDFAKRNIGRYVIENDFLYDEDQLCENWIKHLVIPEIRKREILEIAHESVLVTSRSL